MKSRIVRLAILAIVIVAVGAGLALGVPWAVNELNAQRAEQTMLSANLTAIPQQAEQAQALRQKLGYAPITPANAAQLTEIMRFGLGEIVVAELAYSPDGAVLAVPSGIGIWLYDVDDPAAEPRLLAGHAPAVVLSVAWSPDGTTLASGGIDGTVRLWDAATGTATAVLEGHEQFVTSVLWSPDGRRLASAGYGEGEVRLWNPATGALLDVYNVPSFEAAWSPDGTRIASASMQRIHVWEADTGTLVAEMADVEGQVHSLAWSPDGTRLTAGMGFLGNRGVQLWDAATGEKLAELPGHRSSVWSTAWSPDGSRLASASSDRTVRVWDAATLTELAVLEGHTGLVLNLAWSPDGGQIASSAIDGTVRLWDSSSYTQQVVFDGHYSAVATLAWSPDGTRVVVGHSDGTARIWDTLTGEVLLVYRGHIVPPEELDSVREEGVLAAAWSPDGARVATGSRRGTLHVWDAATAELLDTFQRNPPPSFGGFFRSVAWSPDGMRLAAVETGLEVIIDVARGTGRAFKDARHLAESVAWSPDGARVVVAYMGGHAYVWDMTEEKPIIALPDHGDELTSAAWSPDGSRVAVGVKDGTVWVWDVANLVAAAEDELARGTTLFTLLGHTEAVDSVAWSPDGALLASASDDLTVRVWDAAGGAAVAVLTGVNAVAWSPDGTRLASASYGGVVRLWATAGAEE